MTATRRAIDWTEQGLVPDSVIRHGIRRLLKARLQSLPDDPEAQADARAAFIRDMDAQIIAPSPDKPNEQHYELPAEFFAGVLGAQRKYSCGYWPEGVNDLDRAEEAALHITGERAGLADGMDILELGCGWGSLYITLLRVSGVALLERDIGERRPDYREYVRHTNAFIPGPRKPPLAAGGPGGGA